MGRARPTARLLALLPALVCSQAVWAANYHSGPSLLRCSDCHIMHASKDNIGFGGGTLAPPGFPWLLRAQSVNELCLTCHDGDTGAGDGAPDVSGPASYESSTVRRLAGAFQAAVGATSPNAHDLGVASQTAPGGTWSTGSGLSCVSCHAAHGNSNYRNLVMQPGNASSQRSVTDVTQTALAPTATQYSVTNVRYTGPNGLAAWCQGCHTSFHGAPGDPALGGATGGDAAGSSSYWFRHPTRDVTMAQGVTNGHVDSAMWFTGALSRVPVVSPSGAIPGSSLTSDNEPFCGSCHKPHGSTHRAALIWDDPTTVSLEDGASSTQTCQACHNR